MAESYNHSIIEFPLTEEIKELGISRVCTGVRDNTTEPVLFVECTGLENNSIQCTYDKSNFKKTAKELESVLTEAGMDVKHARKFIVLFSKIWIYTERQSQKTARDYILEEIRKRRKDDKMTTYNNIDPSSDQIDTFWATFLSIEREQESLPSEVDRDTVSGELLRQRLVETGKFQKNDAEIIVERMYKLGTIDRVSYDTYRRRKK